MNTSTTIYIVFHCKAKQFTITGAEESPKIPRVR